MIIREIGCRGWLFTFEKAEKPSAGEVSILLIDGGARLFLCDTHLGPRSMEPVKAFIEDGPGNKELVVFNTHSDWDHIWGNCAFEKPVIVAHEECRKRILEIGRAELECFRGLQNGEVDLVPPNLTFSGRLAFEEEGVEFIHAPGHTSDSALCHDRAASVLFVGDLVEYPAPYLGWSDLETYIKTLEYIRGFPADIKICAHSGPFDEKLIDGNIRYIRDIIYGNPVNTKGLREFAHVHEHNLKSLLILKHEDLLRAKLGADFSRGSFRRRFADPGSFTGPELEKALGEYPELL